MWCCIGESVAGKLSLRIQQLDVRCESKSKDNGKNERKEGVVGWGVIGCGEWCRGLMRWVFSRAMFAIFSVQFCLNYGTCPD